MKMYVNYMLHDRASILPATADVQSVRSSNHIAFAVCLDRRRLKPDIDPKHDDLSKLA